MAEGWVEGERRKGRGHGDIFVSDAFLYLYLYIGQCACRSGGDGLTGCLRSPWW